MSDPYCGEIRIWANQYNPYNWAYCNGTSLSVYQNQCLFAVISYNFGGSGQYFTLPDLRNRAPIGVGSGTGLTPRSYATVYGNETVTLDNSTMARHNHGLNAVLEKCKNTEPSATMQMGIPFNSQSAKVVNLYKTATTSPQVTMSGLSIGVSCGTPTGSVDSHSNIQPSLSMIFCIAIDGVFPVKP